MNSQVGMWLKVLSALKQTSAMFKFKMIMHRDMLEEENILELFFKNLFMLLSWSLGHFQITPLLKRK